MWKRFASTGSLTQLKYFNFFMYGSWSLLNPFLPLYLQTAGFPNVQIGLLMSVGPLISLFANPFWGYWSDRTGNTKLIILIMLIGNIATSQLYFHTRVFWVVFVLMAIFYFFQTALNPITNSLTLRAIEQTPYSFGTFRLWGSVGFALLIILSSPLINVIGVQNLGYLYGIFIVITLGFGLFIPKESGKRSGAKRRFPIQEFRKLAVNRQFLLFLIISTLVSIPNRINSVFISVYINQMGGNDVYVGWSWFFAAALEVPLFMLLDRYLKNSERTMFGLMTLVCGLYTLRWLLMSMAVTPLEVVFIQLLHGFTFGVTLYTGTQICYYLVPKAVQATGQTLYTLCWAGLAGTISGLLGGVVYDRLGPQWMYLLSAGMAGIGVVGYFSLWRHYRKSSQASVPVPLTEGGKPI